MKHIIPKRIVLSCLTAIAMTLALPQNAHAIFGLGDIVYDPANHAENVLTAARTLAQINNQIQQLANDAQMLINQTRNLTRLPRSIASDLQNSLLRMDDLTRSAQGIAYDLAAIDNHYRRLFPESYDNSTSASRILRDAREAWGLARDGFKHSLAVQAEVVGELRRDGQLLDRLMAESQGAVGNLQALQAGNQLTALAAKQSMQLQTLLAASTRAEALERAGALAAHEQGRARFTRFYGDGSAYTR
ncbi:P-type conjugative transfer protein TrbJ [Govanella unica]|uniref:P-type conjugative transfer protein TrbJ n=1 Tax=Govanella unica TaxID=2975056 RepID=A0A9X3Z723_9PROT|nr:P-type conjugative transfer protein TrbJ [Govania unica]MDA5193712.1 P-type conjugative transfer protein TrbJ [Govania unica]